MAVLTTREKLAILSDAAKYDASCASSVNRADREALLRVPGLGTRAVDRILSTRRFRRLRLEDVGRLCASIAKVRPFVIAEGWSPGGLIDRPTLRQKLVRPPRQMELFA